MKKQYNTTPCQKFSISGRMFDSKSFLEIISKSNPSLVKSSDKVEYYNIPAAMDIETSSFYENNEKRSIMYAWMLGINDSICMGRNWSDLIDTLDIVIKIYNLSLQKRLVIYVHNLAYEFQYICKRFEWFEVFSLDIRKPVKAITTDGIEFRCSYRLSGSSLEVVGKNLIKYSASKMIGDLDYSLIRHCETPLTSEEVKYCYNDISVLLYFIQEKIESGESVDRIPITKTGYVRRYCRNSCLYEGSHKNSIDKYSSYSSIMSGLKLKHNEYLMLKAAFQGGFTHASAYRVGNIYNNVKSYDFTSSYPFVMVCEQLPMSSGEKIHISGQQELERQIKKYCCLFNVRFVNIVAKTTIDNPLSFSKCRKIVKPVTDNGRIVSADSVETTITELDYLIYKNFYDWDKLEIGAFIRYRKGYLPTDFIKAILNLYEKKTVLKGVEGMEIEYLLSKEMINASFGMCVTDIARPSIRYNSGEWMKNKADLREVLARYNDDKRRFLFYPWGVWVTAYARFNLFTGLKAFGEDYIYSDTDSIKVLNYQNHLDYIDNYNKIVMSKIKKSAENTGIDISKYMPRTVKGVQKIIGVWDDEGIYRRFKTLGAKRYMYEYFDEDSKTWKVNITVSGVNKKIAVPYMVDMFGDKIFEEFREGLFIPPGKTGKNTLTYIDEYTSGYVTDYLGKTVHYEEYSCIHMEGASYELSFSREFADYLNGVQHYYD